MIWHRRKRRHKAITTEVLDLPRGWSVVEIPFLEHDGRHIPSMSTKAQNDGTAEQSEYSLAQLPERGTPHPPEHTKHHLEMMMPAANTSQPAMVSSKSIHRNIPCRD